jgi:hypothetical protein
MTCEYCGRTITTSFVTKGILHWHAVENEYEQATDRACWERSIYGTQTLCHSEFALGPQVHSDRHVGGMSGDIYGHSHQT